MRLRICLVSQSYLPFHGGITEHVWHLAGALASRGHRVSILTGSPIRRGGPPEQDPPGVRVFRVGRTVRVPSHGGRACVTFGLGWRRTLRPLLAEGLDITHIQSPLEPFLPLWALRNLPGRKVGTFHTGGDTPHWGYVRGSRRLKPYADRLDVRIAVSREARRFVAQSFPGEYEVIPNGVDLTRFARRSARVRPSTPYGHVPQLRALCVSRLDPRKGIGTVLAAMGGYLGRARIHRWPTIDIDVLGNGPMLRPLRRLAARSQLPVHWHGTISRSDLPKFYDQADLFIAPSESGESFGISLLEAMASKLPVISSNIRGYRETLAGSGAALLCEAGSPEALCQALETLAKDPVRRARMGEAGLSYARRFEWPRIAARLERVYVDCLGGSAAFLRNHD